MVAPVYRASRGIQREAVAAAAARSACRPASPSPAARRGQPGVGAPAGPSRPLPAREGRPTSRPIIPCLIERAKWGGVMRQGPGAVHSCRREPLRSRAPRAACAWPFLPGRTPTVPPQGEWAAWRHRRASSSPLREQPALSNAKGWGVHSRAMTPCCSTPRHSVRGCPRSELHPHPPWPLAARHSPCYNVPACDWTAEPAKEGRLGV